MKKPNADNTVNIAGCLYIPPKDVDINEELYGAYRDLLLTGKTTSNSWLAKMLEKDFKALATKDTDDALKVIKEVGRIAEKTNEYFESKKEGDASYIEYLIDRGFFPWQREVLECYNKNIQLIAGRRTGKSYFMARYAVRHCAKGYDIINGAKKKRTVLLLGLTLTRAKDIFWENIKAAIDDCKLPTDKIDNSNYSVEFSNGSSISLGGTSTKAEIQKYRGGDYSLIMVDECQSIKGMMTLIKDVLEPIQTGRDSTIIVSGTGPLFLGSYYAQLCDDPKWAHYRYNMMDNPTVPIGALEGVLEKNGWTPDNPTYRREYLAETVLDEDLLMIPHREYFDISEIKKAEYNKAMICCDWGMADKSAIGLILYNDNGEMRLVWEWAQAQQPSSKLVEKTLEAFNIAKDKWNIDISNIKAVADNSNGNVNRELYMRGLTFLQDAYKVDWLYQVNRLNEACYTGKLKVIKSGEFDMECDKAVWKKDEETGKIIYEEDKATFHPDQLHAVRYGVNTILTELYA